MTRWARRLGVGAALMAAGSVAGSAPAPELAYQLTEGQNLNVFVRDGSVAAHLLLRNGIEPRILVAFPAGNSGVGLWFEPLTRAATWRLEQAPQPVDMRAAHGPAMPGIETVASIDAPRLVIRQAVLSNIRFLRDYQSVGRFPAGLATSPVSGPGFLLWQRQRIDGRSGYKLSLRILSGRLEGNAIIAGADGRIRLRIGAGTGEVPLHGLTEAELLNDHAAPDPVARHALAFLSYREKFLAGSWRFDTYFGRDTLMSIRLLMPVLKPAAVEAGLTAVLARLSPDGEVAHEEGIGEFAVVQNRKAGRNGDAPELDYGMVDDDYMLGAVAVEYLLGSGRAGAAAFLSRPFASEATPGAREPAGRTLARNLLFVVRQTAPFATRPSARTLLAIKPGRMTGEWRDSDEGLGRGIYPYDVNAALAPAALEAADRLLAAGLLDPYLSADDRASLGRAGAFARVWRARAAPLFRVTLPNTQAVAAIRGYAASLRVPAAPALASLGQAPLVFHALSLDANGAPVPIINSDEGFALLFGEPSAADLDTYVTAITRPFPAGLMTGAGLLVANAAQAPLQVQARFTPAAYHGAVVWSWQQALLAAGLEHQLARADLPPATRARLRNAQARLWRTIEATRAFQSSELWSWVYRDGGYHVVAFGAGKRDVDESNAAQLWSTVYLAVRPPKILSGTP